MSNPVCKMSFSGSGDYLGTYIIGEMRRSVISVSQKITTGPERFVDFPHGEIP